MYRFSTLAEKEIMNVTSTFSNIAKDFDLSHRHDVNLLK